MKERDAVTLSGDLLDETEEITVGELCRVCSVEQTLIDRLVEEGILEPVGERPGELRFHYSSVRRIGTVTRLQNDLGVNLPGAALALDLLDRIEELRRRLRARGIGV